MIGYKMKKNSNIAVNLTNISKKYIIHHEKPTLIEKLINGRNKEFFALQNINLKIKKGERVGIIGSNGTGKTTLLKIISGISTPTTGKVKTAGKIISLIDLGAGFHTDLTGLQNISLNGMLIGMSKKEIENKTNDIVEFADIGDFIDTQLFMYSSGMQLRLGFSVAIHADPDILILDENISVGDQDFKKKSFEKIQELFNKGKTVVIASHNMDLIGMYCDKVCWLRKGTIFQFGPTKKVINNYLKSQI
jgi:ABC-type polysaccharide/polyol phosphate transport system ATPase subunit